MVSRLALFGALVALVLSAPAVALGLGVGGQLQVKHASQSHLQALIKGHHEHHRTRRIKRHRRARDPWRPVLVRRPVRLLRPVSDAPAPGLSSSTPKRLRWAMLGGHGRYGAG